LIWFKFNIKDYLASTAHLSDAEDLAYRRLLDLYFLSEQPISLDLDAVARKIRIDLDITELVLDDFFQKTNAGYVNARCEAEIAKYNRQVKVNQELGKKGGRPKKEV